MFPLYDKGGDAVHDITLSTIGWWIWMAFCILGALTSK